MDDLAGRLNEMLRHLLSLFLHGKDTSNTLYSQLR